MLVVPGDVPIYFVPRSRQTLYPVWSFVAVVPVMFEGKRFRKDLARLPRHIQEKWRDVKENLARSTRDSGVNFEKVGNTGNRFSVRLTKSVRAILQLDEGHWTAIGVRTHDAAYRRAAR